MKKSELKQASLAQLSEAKAAAAAALEKDPQNKELPVLIEAINAEFKARNEQEQKEEKPSIRVRAKIATAVDGVTFAKDQEGVLTTRQFNAVSRHFDKIGLIALLALLACVFAPRAQAQQDPVTYLVQTNDTSGLGTNKLNGTSGTMAVPATAATNLYIPLPYVGRYRYVNVFYASKQMSGTATDVNVAHLDTSPDGSTTNWVNLADISNTAATTTIVKGYTNLDLPNQSFARLAYISNACATIMTNVIVAVSVKSRHFGAADIEAPVFVLNAIEGKFREYKQRDLPEEVRNLLIESGVIEQPEDPMKLAMLRREREGASSLALAYAPRKN